MEIFPWREATGDHYALDDRKTLPKKPLPDVHRLWIGRNHVPDLAMFPNTRAIWFRGTPWERLPDVFRQATTLSHLHSFELDDIDMPQLPDELRLVKRLRWLEVNSSNIEVLPSWIGEMKIEALSLEHSAFATLPDELGTLPLKALTIGGYPFYEKKLERLPSTFQQWTKLAYLYAYETKLPSDQLEALLRLPSIRHLGLSHHEPRPMLGELRQLTSLSIEHAECSALPDYLGELVNLELFRVAMTPVRDVPAWLPKLKKLRRLEAFTQIDVDVAELVGVALQLPKLEELHLPSAAPKPARKKLLEAGFVQDRGNPVWWERGKPKQRYVRNGSPFPHR
jgi:Leucine-rich repeat (LRR) protein